MGHAKGVSSHPYYILTIVFPMVLLPKLNNDTRAIYTVYMNQYTSLTALQYFLQIQTSMKQSERENLYVF